MKRYEVLCCNEFWRLDLEVEPMVGDLISLIGVDDNDKDVWLLSTIIKRSINPYLKKSQVSFVASLHESCGMSMEIIKKEITPKCAFYD